MTSLNTTVSLDLIISASAGFLAIVGVYIRLKVEINILRHDLDVQAKEIEDLQKKEEKLSSELSEYHKEASQNHSKLETSMAQMELRIIREFQNVVSQIVSKTKN